MATQNPTPYASSNPSMYTPPTLQAPTPTYAIPGSNERSANPQQAVLNAQSGNMTSVPGVGMVPQGTYGTQSSVSNPAQPAQPGAQAVSTSQTPQIQAGQTEAIKNLEAPVPPTDSGAKYQAALPSMKGAAPNSAAEARTAVAQATSQYQAPTEAYAPTPQFMQVGDPIMQQYMQAAQQAQQEVITTGYAAKNLQTIFGKQLQGIDLEAANMKNIIEGTRSDIQAEVAKTGGLLTASQLEGMVATRNRDLLKSYNNLELQKQTMQNQMQMQVQLSQADHQYAVDKFNGVNSQATLYRNIYDNAQNQVDKQIQNLGYKGIAEIYAGNPGVLSMYERFLSMPQGTLSDPKKVAAMDTYRERTLSLSASRFNAMYGFAPGGNGSPSPTGSATYSDNMPGGGPHPQTNPNVSYEQYGLLSNTNFDPKSSDDQTALNYLNVYLNNGTVPNATAIGLRGPGNAVSGKFQAATTRANDLYFAATGQNLPAPSIIKNNIGLISANNKLANSLKVQENTVKANFGLALQNLNENNINTAWPILNNAINFIKNAEGDPNVAQYFAQNTTLQQELGNLIAVKNAQGTTVHDKIVGAGLIPKNATMQQQVAIAKVLLQEAMNAGEAINSANSELYSSVDPLERQKDNPNRQNYLNSKAPKDFVKMSGPDGKQFNVPPNKVEEMKKHGYK